ncbi:hypothetical protein JCGZ_09043 [Jatropha curcas]|uniref:Uncharacterized protein n=1 Tax=Jatropha curcas TaxID=180498 RepID=A0A067KTK6_JATCU|nr:hypothetical protein JCGZ_09043 [Jatropha curcas]
MLNNAYKLFNIKVDFVELIAGDNMKIEKDDDVLFIFEMFKDTLVVLVHVIAVNTSFAMVVPDSDSDVVGIVASNVGGNRAQTRDEGETQGEGMTQNEGETQVEGVTQVEEEGRQGTFIAGASIWDNIVGENSSQVQGSSRGRGQYGAKGRRGRVSIRGRGINGIGFGRSRGRGRGNGHVSHNQSRPGIGLSSGPRYTCEVEVDSFGLSGNGIGVTQEQMGTQM